MKGAELHVNKVKLKRCHVFIAVVDGTVDVYMVNLRMIEKTRYNTIV